MSEASDPLVHLLRPQGGSQCGRPGPVDADINFITCDDCDEQHEALQEPRCISYEVAMAGGSPHPEAVVAELRNLAMVLADDADPEDLIQVQLRMVKLSAIVLDREDPVLLDLREVQRWAQSEGPCPPYREGVARMLERLDQSFVQLREGRARAEEQVRHLSALRGVDAAEMARLPTPTLPGSIPGLLRRGSPVVIASEDGCVPRHLWGKAATVHRVAPSDLGVPLVSLTVDGCEAVVVAGLDVLALDLTDATGRAHAAWWLAGALYPECPPTDGAAVAWQLFPGQQPLSGWWLRYCVRGDSGGSTTVSPTFSGRWNPRMWTQHIVALADLEPSDPRLLEDGSRWVDAEALRLVCLHVAGGGQSLSEIETTSTPARRGRQPADE